MAKKARPNSIQKKPICLENNSLDVKTWSNASSFLCQYGKKNEVVGGTVMDLRLGLHFLFQDLDFEKPEDTNGVHLIINN